MCLSPLCGIEVECKALASWWSCPNAMPIFELPLASFLLLMTMLIIMVSLVSPVPFFLHLSPGLHQWLTAVLHQKGVVTSQLCFVLFCPQTLPCSCHSVYLYHLTCQAPRVNSYSFSVSSDFADFPHCFCFLHGWVSKDVMTWAGELGQTCDNGKSYQVWSICTENDRRSVNVVKG